MLIQSIRDWPKYWIKTINMKKKIVIGIPSYNEEETIGYVVKQVDYGLRRYFPLLKCLIVNIDSGSTDNTKQVFLKTQTLFPKKYLNIGTKNRGKGKNIIKLFKYCNDLDVDYIALFDSDIKTIEPSWVFLLLSPLVYEKFDYTIPAYSRGCYDGNVTNNFARPLTYAVFGVDFQQPIGGEFGLNKHLYKYLLTQSINENELGFGIDIFMTYHAIGSGFKVCEVYLGKKEHKPGFPTLMNKFMDFSRSALEVSKIYRNKLNKIIKPIKECRNIQISKTRKQPDEKLVAIQLRKFAQDFEDNLLEYNKYLNKELISRLCKVIIKDQEPIISSTLWINTLAGFLNVYYKENSKTESLPKICRLIAPIFYWRVISFWKEIKYLDQIEINKRINNQSKLLKKKLVLNKNVKSNKNNQKI